MSARPATLLLTCEHGGNKIPREWAHVFRGARALLASHRGWDPGALALARLLAKRLDVPLLASTWSRLLVEANRSEHLPKIWSSLTAPLAAEQRREILERYWRPHRAEVEGAVAKAIARGRTVVHVAVHSFTPVLNGEVRTADVAFLYDSRRKPEAALARRWARALAAAVPGLRVRLNYPYRGSTDGLPTALRKRHPAARYQGFELEVNQALLASPGWRDVGEALARVLAT